MSCYLSLSISEDILQLNMWWRAEYQGLYFGITISKAPILYTKGLRYFRDIWEHGRYEFLNWEIANVKFSLEDIYHDL